MKRREFIRLVAAGGVVGMTSTAWGQDHSAEPSQVQGRVTSAGRPLAEVLVSNGRQVVRTDADGRYTLPTGPDAGRFVFVCCPRGYWTDDFYHSMDGAVREGKTDFELRPVPQPDRFDFVFACDLADLENPHQTFGRRKVKASIAEICSLSPRPAFLWIQGDLGIRDGGARFLECLHTATIPTRVGIGNHEIVPTAANPKEIYEQILGPTYYSFDWGPIHFIVLDGNKPTNIPGGSVGTVEPREWAWLEADLAAQPPEKPIVVGVHIPIVSTYPARRTDLKETEAPFWQSANGAELTKLLARYHVRLVLQAHMHENERITRDGVEYVSSVSLSGSWWHGRDRFERATDGVPRGYRIVSIDGDHIAHRYQSSCESRVEQQGEFMDLPAEIAQNKSVSFVFNGYDAPQGSTAEAKLDNGPWQAMEPVILPDSGLERPHHWRLTVDANLPARSHLFAVRVTWPDGTKVWEQARFNVIKPVEEDESNQTP